MISQSRPNNIRGKKFKGEHLIGADFRYAMAGQRFLYRLGLLTVGFIVACAMSGISMLNGGFLAGAIYNSVKVHPVFCAIEVSIYFAALIIIVHRGFNLVGACSLFILALLCSLCFTLVTGASELNSIWTASFALLAGVSFAYLEVGLIALLVVFNTRCFNALTGLLTVFVTVLATSLLLFLSINVTSDHKTYEEILSLIPATLSIFSGALIAKKTMNGSSQFAWIEDRTVFWAAIGGTSFYEANLIEANFESADLKHTDFRARKFHRTCLKDVKGLEKARVDNRYFDLDNLKVQKLLTQGSSENHEFSRINLRGAYLQNADMRQFNLTETNLDCADLRGADLRESVLLRTILTNADLSRIDLTGACIKDWSFNQQTQFDGIVCNYVYRDYEDDRPTDRYPPDRNFEPGEFQSLFQKLTNAVELVFKDQVDWRALSFTFDKFRLEDDGLELELKGVEQRGDYWIVKVTHKEGIPRQEVEQKVIATYEDLRGILAAKDQQINRLMGIMENQTSTLQNQSEALKNYSTQPFGNIFNITGSTITNLAGSGHIEYAEAANQVRSIIAQGSDPAQMTQKLQQLLAQFQQQNVAITLEQQAELLRQLILSEAGKDEIFKGFLKQQEQQILQGMPPGAIASAIHSAIEQLG